MAHDAEISEAEIAEAEDRGRAAWEPLPRAAAARYDRSADRVVIELANGCTFLFPPKLAEDLQAATPDQLAQIEVSPAGFALHWPQVDVDFSVAGLLAGTFGTARFMAAQNDRSPEPDDEARAAHAPGGGGRPRKPASA